MKTILLISCLLISVAAVGCGKDTKKVDCLAYHTGTQSERVALALSSSMDESSNEALLTKATTLQKEADAYVAAGAKVNMTTPDVKAAHGELQAKYKDVSEKAKALGDFLKTPEAATDTAKVKTLQEDLNKAFKIPYYGAVFDKCSDYALDMI